MNRTRLFHAAAIAFAIFALAPSTPAASQSDPECGDPTAWSGFTHILLTQTYTGAPQGAEWDAVFDQAANDMLVHMNMRDPSTPMRGEVAMVGGRVMLSKGVDLKPGYEIDALDAPALSMKLVMIILGRVFPQGPSQLSAQQVVDHTDKIGIKFATASASGYIPAPWTLQGEVRKLGEQKVSFDLTLSFHMQSDAKAKQTFSMHMTGELGMLNHPVFLDTDTLDGWTTYGLGPRQIKQGNAAIFDYGATPDKNAAFHTIGDIRAFIAAENHPGFKDPTKDFTGFWKEECGQPFGLQIMHQGDEGKYSVVFCGPGGCGDPSQTRLTYISGDQRFEVVSEDELIEIERSGERSTLHRCTRDTHPNLKYTD